MKKYNYDWHMDLVDKNRKNKVDVDLGPNEVLGPT